MEEMHHCSEDVGVFGWVDYTVLGAMLVISSSVGLFYGWASPSSSGSDFLLAGGTMSTLPTALSLAAGFITAIELLGNPAEMYFHGSQFWMIVISFFLVVPLTSSIYLPVFMRLRLTSSYEYLELRFSKPLRIIASSLYLVQMTLYTSVAVYAPALALSHVTGMNTYLAIIAVYVVCVFYASQGGIKAVIIADSFQATLLVISILAVMLIGNKLSGGFETILKDSLLSHRIELFNFSTDPTVRHSFWSVVVGGTFYWATMFCSNQASVQKYLSVQNISQARRALWTSCFSLLAIFTVNFYTGMVTYSKYQKCDPYTQKEIVSQDEILPIYVMQALGSYTGLPGLFVSGIFAASLGTVASAVNSLAAVCMRDIMTGLFNMSIPDSKAASVSKWLSVFFGLASFSFVFLVEKLGSVLQVALSFNGITGGVTLGLFTLGMVFPWANSRGAAVGSLTALALVTWMATGAQVYSSMIPNEFKPLSTEGCPCNQTKRDIFDGGSLKEGVWWFYKISYLWYSAIGCLVTLVLGAVISVFTTPQNPTDLDRDLISPPIFSLLTSLPNSLKEKINLPIISKDSLSCAKISDIKAHEMNGIDNPTLIIDS